MKKILSLVLSSVFLCSMTFIPVHAEVAPKAVCCNDRRLSTVVYYEHVSLGNGQCVLKTYNLARCRNCTAIHSRTLVSSEGCNVHIW